MTRSVNQGKGAAVYYAAKYAQKEGITHMLVMDSDGQHPVDEIQAIMALSKQNPEAMIMGRPRFGKEAPRIRVMGHRISYFWISSLSG